MSVPLYVQIRTRFQLGPAYHMTHIDNLEGILRAGNLRPYSKMRGQSYRNLANQDVQDGRALVRMEQTGRPLHDYVPLYFGFQTPMVAWNQEENPNLLFLRFSLSILSRSGVVISDGNARSKATRFRQFQGLDDLSILNVKAIQTLKYAKDPEVKRMKQAEILVPDFIPISEIYDVICYSQTTAKAVLQILNSCGIKKSVNVNPGWYFIQKQEGSKT
jgi:hypothetical protein